MNSNKELAGKVAIVTGSGRNIGRAIARQLADAGAAVVVNAQSNKTEAENVVREIEAAGGKAVVCLGGVGDPKTAETLAATALKHFGRIDILVNNAGMRAEQPFEQMTYADWRKIMDVTLDGAFHCAKACLPALKKSGAGAIVNFGGMSAHRGARDRAHVITAKAGLVGFTRALAHDLAGDKITVNCVVPGAVNTTRPATSQNPAHHLTHGTITGERGDPNDLGATVRFLVGPGARFITGQTIHVNGGAYLGV
ncbi:MAG TPA: SDR family oxidoreductase [Pseudolabrys sp.]|nr:SDR family oxidoreductase [Pseudolabrys sp.]